MTPQCPECGAAVGWTARICDACGEPNSVRRNLFGTAAALGVLLIAGAVAVFVATRERPLIEGIAPVQEPPAPGQAPPAPAQSPGTAVPRDFAWLEQAMKACDDKAAQDTGTLHILVVPLAVDPAKAADWRSSALNEIGNAIVLSGTQTIDALKQGTFTISADEYVFSVRDEATKVVYRWDPASGVKWITSAQAGTIKSLRMQFKPKNAGSDESWGNAVDHKAGFCYWINALVQL